MNLSDIKQILTSPFMKTSLFDGRYEQADRYMFAGTQERAFIDTYTPTDGDIVKFDPTGCVAVVNDKAGSVSFYRYVKALKGVIKTAAFGPGCDEEQMDRILASPQALREQAYKMQLRPQNAGDVVRFNEHGGLHVANTGARSFASYDRDGRKTSFWAPGISCW